MAKKTEIQYVIDAITGSGFGKTMRTVNKELTGLKMARAEIAAGSKKGAQGMAILGGGMIKSAIGAAVAYIGIHELVGVYKECTQAAGEDLIALNRLRTTMLKTPGTTMANVTAVQKYAKASMGWTTIARDSTEAGASQIAVTGMHTNSILKLLPALQDLAVFQHGMNVSQDQAIQTGKMIAKMYGGNAGAAKRAGIVISAQQAKILKHGTELQKVAAILEIVEGRLGGLARSQTKIDPGRVLMLKNAWGEVKKELGFKLLPVQEKVVKFLSDNLPAISGLIDKGFGGIDKIAAAIKPALGGLAPVLGQVAKALPGMGAGLGKIFGPLVKALPSIAGGLLKVCQPIIGFIGGKLLPFVKRVAADVIGLFLQIWPKVQPALVQLGGSIGKLLTAIMPILKGIWAVAKPILGFVLGTVLPLVIKGISLLVTAVSAIVSGLISAVKWVGSLFAGFWKIVKLLAKYSGLGLAIQAGQAVGKAVGRRASGGPVSAGRSYWVGERGPELLTMLRNGFVSPTPALAGAGGGGFHINTVNITVQGGPPAQARKAGELAGKGFIEELRRYEQDRDRRSFKD